jgi:hypothetical protein
MGVQMKISSAHSIFALAAAAALLSLTGGALAAPVQGSGIVGSVIVQGHKTTCKEVTETQCMVDSKGRIYGCHEVQTTQCTVADVTHGPGSPLSGLAGAPASLSRSAGSLGAPPSTQIAAPPARISTFRLR